jgi:hypothetical protein
MATHTVRNQQQLGDFLFSSDLAKLRLGKTGNKARINMNRLREEQLSSSILSLDNSSCSTLPGTEGRGDITNLNYVKNKNTAKKERRKDQVDNAKFQGNGKNSRSASKSPKSRTRKELKQKENIRNEETKVVAMDLDEDTDEDKRKCLNLQAEIEKEQEYQNQMNMIYNNPNYFDQYSSDLLYRPDCHNPQPDQLILDPQIMLQNPPMYFLAGPQQHFESQLLDFPPVDSSSASDLSYSVSSSCSETSEDESSRSSPDYHNSRYSSEDDENNVPFELDEELNNLVLSIIAD